MTAAIGTRDARLADQCPKVFTGSLHLKQTGERIAATESRLHLHIIVGLVVFFVAGFRLFPSGLRTNLRTEERLCSVGETEGGALLIYNGTLGIVLCRTGQRVAECHVVVAHLERHQHVQPIGRLIVKHQLVGLILDMRCLRLAHVILFADGFFVAVHVLQVLCEITQTG